MEQFVLPDTYPLQVNDKHFDLRIYIEMKTYPKTNRKRIICSVPFPEDYPHNDFYRTVSEMRDENPQRIATLNLLYDTDKNSLGIAIFYVYSAFSTIKPYVTKEEQLQLKGLGIFILCKVLHFLLSKIKGVSPETKVTLTASGDQCYDIETYKDYKTEDCLEIIKNYPYALLIILKINNLIQSEDNDIHIKHPEILYTLIRKHIEENPGKIIILRELVCNIITNQRLIEHYKGVYNFNVDKNLGTEAIMSGTVANILSACKNRLDRSGNPLLAFSLIKKKKSGKKSGKKRGKKSGKKRS
jgi:hypothetical protein